MRLGLRPNAKLYLRTAAVLAAALCLGACDEDWNMGRSDRYREDFHFNYPLSAGGRLTLDNFNGSVEISGWDKDTVDITGTKYASTESRLHEIHIDVMPSTGLVSVRTSRPTGPHWGNAGARYTIRVPRKADLDGITSSNGSINIDFMDGRARLRTSNGAIKARTVSGPLDAQTSNGSVDATDITGDSVLRTSNGKITAEIRRGGLDAHTSNGGISVRLDERDPKPVRLESSNGHIDLSMSAMREVRASTSNSSITVHLPGSAAADLRARTSNSSVTTDFDVSVRGMLSKHSLEGRIGAGGPLLDLSTSNGAIRVLRQ